MCEKSYLFDYFFKEEEEFQIEIKAISDKEAVLKLFDKVGICKFYCINEDEDSFTDLDFKEERELIKKGC